MNRLIQSLIFLALLPHGSASLSTPKLLCCPTALFNQELIGAATNLRKAPDNGRLSPDEGHMLSTRHFAELVALHNKVLPELTKARTLLAAHAEALAQLVKSLPGAALLNETAISGHIRHWKKTLQTVSGATVFKPWTNRWQGLWSDGSAQFHIWDKTRRWGAQWVQVVAQSEHGFPEENRLSRLIEENRTDLGINVYSKQNGVTGWVAKRQHGEMEIPCLGYVIAPSILLWVCAMDYAGDFVAGQWFVYLEQVAQTAAAHHYVIDGLPFTIEDQIKWDKTSPNIHAGRYSAGIASPTKRLQKE